MQLKLNFYRQGLDEKLTHGSLSLISAVIDSGSGGLLMKKG